MVVTNKVLERNGSKTRFNKGQTPHNFTGKSITWSGYIEVFSPDHPNKTKRGYVKEHRLVVEKDLGRFLTKDEQVHHINGNKQDNRLINLQVVSHQEHLRIHGSLIEKRWAKYRKAVVPNALHAK